MIGINGTPTTSAGGNWDYMVDSNLNASSPVCGTMAGPGNDFFCGAESTGGAGYPANPTNTTYEWQFTLQIAGVTDVHELVVNAPLRALFTDGYGKYALMSETTSVPEPASILLFGVGLAGVLGVGLRRRRLP